MEDETGGGRGRSADGPDPSFIKRLEDDALWSSKPDGEAVRRTSRERTRASSRSAAARQQRHDRRNARRTRWIAAAGLVVVAVVIALVGVELKASEYGSSGGKATPFSILPIDNIRVTTTTDIPTTTSAPVTTSTSTTSTTTPVAVVIFR